MADLRLEWAGVSALLSLERLWTIRHEAWWLTYCSNAVEPALEKFRQYSCRAVDGRWTSPAPTSRSHTLGGPSWVVSDIETKNIFSCCIARPKSGFETMAAERPTSKTQSSSSRSFSCRTCFSALPPVFNNSNYNRQSPRTSWLQMDGFYIMHFLKISLCRCQQLSRLLSRDCAKVYCS